MHIGAEDIYKCSEIVYLSFSSSHVSVHESMTVFAMVHIVSVYLRAAFCDRQIQIKRSTTYTWRQDF